MRFVRSEVYFPIIVGAHLVLWGIDLALHSGSVSLYEGESAVQRVLGEMFSSWVITVFGFNLLMATRARWVERVFGGLDKMYLIHRRAGVIAVVLLLLHFGVVPRAPEFSVGKPLGFAAMVLIFFGVVVAAAPVFKRRIPYQKWLSGHRIMGLFYVVGVIHAFTVPTLISQLPLVRTYVFGMAAIGVGSWFYKAFLHRRVRRPLPYTVATVRRWGNAIVELKLRPDGAAMSHAAGQFAFFTFPGIAVGESHPFTIASAPDDAELCVVVKASGDFTADLVARAAEGDPVLAEGPYGQFIQERVSGDSQIWVAGGVGITPFLSLVRGLGPRSARLTWSVRTADEAVFHDELTAIANNNPHFDYSLWISNEQGYLGAGDVCEAAVEQDADVLICGPVALRDGIEKGLRARGVPAARVHSEEFAFR